MHVDAAPLWRDAPLDPERLIYVSSVGADEATVLDVGWTVGGHGIRIRYAEGATFWIGAELNEVWLRYSPPLTAPDAAHFLCEPVLAFLLRLRGTLTLHASSVAIDGRAVLICGHAGAGKSSLAAACLRAGALLMSDDITAVIHEARWMAHPGTPAIRLWEAGARAFVDDPRALPEFSATWSKRVLVPSRLGAMTLASPAPVALVVVLAPRSGRADPIAMQLIRGYAAVWAVVPHTAARFLHDDARRARELEQLAALLSEVGVAQLTIPDEPRRLDEAVRTVQAAVRA